MSLYYNDLYSVIDLSDDGWETVRRSRSKTSPVSKASTSSKGSIGSISNGKFQKPVSTKDSESKRNSTHQRNPGRNTTTAPTGKLTKSQVNGEAGKKGGKERNGSSYRDAVIKPSSTGKQE